MKLLLKNCFSIFNLKVPNIDIDRYMSKSKGWQADCEQVADSLQKFGLIYVKDNRVNVSQNNEFLDMMENYFELRSNQFDAGKRNIDVVQMQNQMPLGIKHCYSEKFVSYKEDKEKLKPPHLSLTPFERVVNPTWRFHWVLNSPNNVLPVEFPEFPHKINLWGQNLKKCSLIIAEMAALGLGLEKDAFTRKIVNGDFYVSPTGIDLRKSEPGKLLTAFHRDLDLLTIHGRSRYLGLYAWLNTGQKFLVNMPEGHLLVQCGKQLEWLTGGLIKAGYHEVIHNELVEKAKQQAIKSKRLPWRICSVMFCQVQGNQSLKPYPQFLTKEVQTRYPDITADEHAIQELTQLINTESQQN